MVIHIDETYSKAAQLELANVANKQCIDNDEPQLKYC